MIGSRPRRAGSGGSRLPPWTIRARLTMLYGTVFLITGVILLTVGYVLVHQNLNQRLGLVKALLPSASHSSTTQRFETQVFHTVRASLIHSTLQELLRYYVGALLLMTGISVAAGWWLAGRALAPLRAITDTAQRVSGENLGERISLKGPQDELKRLADTIDGMLSRLDGAFASQRRFVANASHELRTPLTIMRTEVDVALADPRASADELREMGEAVRETIDRSEALIAALLMLARSETVTVAERPVDVAELAGDCITDLHRQAEEAEVEIRAALAPAVVLGDPALLERLLANLIDNGIRHNVSGGSLAVSTGIVGDAVEIRVANSGPVISPEDVESLLAPFRRLSRQPGGFGLGLSIVDSVVKAHGGELLVSARPEGGLDIRARFSQGSEGRSQGMGETTSRRLIFTRSHSRA